jgi:hypothetical protein
MSPMTFHLGISTLIDQKLNDLVGFVIALVALKARHVTDSIFGTSTDL